MRGALGAMGVKTGGPGAESAEVWSSVLPGRAIEVRSFPESLVCAHTIHALLRRLKIARSAKPRSCCIPHHQALGNDYMRWRQGWRGCSELSVPFRRSREGASYAAGTSS